MMRRFCPKCGKTTEELKDGLCKSCYMQKDDSAGKDIPSSVKLYLCECTATKIKNRWITYDRFRDAIKACLKSECKEFKKRDIEIEIPEGTTISGKVTIPVKVSWSDPEKSYERSIDIIVIPNTCPVCSRRYGGYYEATLQLRGNVRDVSKLKCIVEDNVKRCTNKDVFITSESETKNGVDIYLSSIKFAKKLSKELSSNDMVVDVKESFSNFGLKDGKDLKRATYLLRCE